MKTTYCATFIGNDHLLLKHYESGEHYGYIGGTERLASAAEELLHAACRKSGIIEQIAGSDIEFRNSASHYISIMLDSECDYHDLRNTVRRICDGNGARALELLTLTALDHYESETRKEAVESFIREAVENLPSLSEEETEEVRDPLMTYRLTSWFIDEFKELVQNRIDDAIIECRDKPKIRLE